MVEVPPAAIIDDRGVSIPNAPFYEYMRVDQQIKCIGFLPRCLMMFLLMCMIYLPEWKFGIVYRLVLCMLVWLVLWN